MPLPSTRQHRSPASARRILTLLLVAGSMAVSGCQSTSERIVNWIKPYRIDIAQGNFVSREMVEQLKPGMSREQVRFVLGTPLLTDIFHSDRWDYVYRLQRGNGSLEQRRLTVHFSPEGRLLRFDSDVMPSERHAAAPARGTDAGSTTTDASPSASSTDTSPSPSQTAPAKP